MGISDAPQNVAFEAMSVRQQQLAKVILQDADVASLSSFIAWTEPIDAEQRAHPDQLEAPE